MERADLLQSVILPCTRLIECKILQMCIYFVSTKCRHSLYCNCVNLRTLFVFVTVSMRGNWEVNANSRVADRAYQRKKILR